MAQKRSKAATAGKSRMPASSPAAQMVLFTLTRGMTLEIHIPGATSVTGGPSRARTPGFILRRGREIVNVGVLAGIFED